jgi:hypothetical protein
MKDLEIIGIIILFVFMDISIRVDKLFDKINNIKYEKDDDAVRRIWYWCLVFPTVLACLNSWWSGLFVGLVLF